MHKSPVSWLRICVYEDNSNEKPEGFRLLHSKTNSKQNHEQMRLDLGLGKMIDVEFDGGQVCSDGGLLFLVKADQRLELTKQAAWCIGDRRRADLISHSIQEMLQQRIYGICAGYEDCNDASKLNGDAMHLLATGNLPSSGNRLASQPTLSRFENSVDEVTLQLLQELPIHVWISKLKAKRKRPKTIRLSMDTTCDPVHGYQQLSFYNGFYETDCYTPLFVFTEDGFPLAAVLRPGNAAPAEGSVRALKRICEKIRLAFGNVPIELTADAGFAVPELFKFCEDNRITYFIGAIGHSGLQYHAEELVVKCRGEFEKLAGSALELKKYGEIKDKKARDLKWRQREERIRFSSKSAGRQQEHFEEQLTIRRFGEFSYQSREWHHERRFIFRVEFTSTGPDVRFVVTNKKNGKPRELYEERYCKRGQCENWIKDLKNYLKADRTSCQEWNANQFRLLLHAFAYILMGEIRTAACMPFSTVETIRIRFLKVGVLVCERARTVSLKLASHHPWADPFRHAWHALF